MELKEMQTETTSAPVPSEECPHCHGLMYPFDSTAGIGRKWVCSGCGEVHILTRRYYETKGE